MNVVHCVVFIVFVSYCFSSFPKNVCGRFLLGVWKWGSKNAANIKSEQNHTLILKVYNQRRIR